MQQYGKKKSFCIFKTQSSNTSEVAHSPVTTALTPHFINTRSQWSWNINTIFKCVVKIRKVPTEVVREVPFFWTITSYWLPKLHLLEMNPRRTGGCSHPVLSVKPLLWALGEWQAEVLYRSSDHLNLPSPRVQFRAVGSLLSLCRKVSSEQAAKGKMFFPCFKACMWSTH